MGFTHDAATWARLESLYAQASSLPTGRRAQFVDGLSEDDPRIADELASLLSVTGPSSKFFRYLERSLFERAEDEDTGAVLARFDPLVGTTVAERYRVEGVRGRGGMGTVYQAVDETSGETVALKVLSFSLNSHQAARERFFREARTAASLRHPNVCGILDVAEADDGSPFLVMPFYDGMTLMKRLRQGALPLEEASDWLRQACAGLAAVHKAKIIHRDLSPGNLMRTRSGEVLLLDFGLAKIADVTLGTGTRKLGTLPYMSPEQLLGERFDKRTDVWSMAVVFYEMLAGVRPFVGDSLSGVREAILTDDPVPLSDVCDDVPQALSDVVAKALSKRANKRPATASRLAAVVERATA